MVTSFSLFIPVKVKEISASISGIVKKIETKAEKWFSYLKNMYYDFNKAIFIELAKYNILYSSFIEVKLLSLIKKYKCAREICMVSEHHSSTCFRKIVQSNIQDKEFLSF